VQARLACDSFWFVELLGLAHGSAADVDDPEFVVEEETDGVVLGLSVGVDAGEPAEALAEEVVALGGVSSRTMTAILLPGRWPAAGISLAPWSPVGSGVLTRREPFHRRA
jgi:hypothetical protein